MLNALLGAVTVLLVYLIVKRVWGRRTALLAAAFTAVFPPLVLLCRDLVSESLFIPLMLAAILCVLEYRRSGGGWRWAAAAGGFCGIAVLTRNTGFVLLLPIGLGLWRRPARPLGSSLAPMLVALACAILVVSPWLLRDAAEFGRFVPVTTSGGIALGGTYNEASKADSASHGAWRNPQVVPEYTRLFRTPGLDESEVDRTLRKEALGFAWQHPGYVAETSAWNVLRLFEVVGGSVVDRRGHDYADRGVGSTTPTAERVGLAVALALALAGATALIRSRRSARRAGGPPAIPSGPLFLWLVPLAMLAIAIPIAGVPRYRLPADPFLMMLAAIGALWLLDRTVHTAETR